MMPRTVFFSSLLALAWLAGCGAPPEERNDPWGVRPPGIANETQEMNIRGPITRLEPASPPQETAEAEEAEEKPEEKPAR